MVESDSCAIFGLNILLENEWVQDHAVIVEEGVIAAIIEEKDLRFQGIAKLYEFPSDYYLIPGLIDLHIHGANGSDVMDAKADALDIIAEALAAEGVTGFLATTMTAPRSKIESVLKTISRAMSSLRGAAILGVHLEGPFISSAKIGAQSKQALEIPNPTLLNNWQAIAEGAIKLITLAPELAEAQTLIRLAKSLDIQVSIGHTNATYEETCAAIAGGCQQATHLFNAMCGLHQREPGAVGALLLDPTVGVELIVDGIHVHPAMIDLALKLKGKEKILLVTDAIRAKCLGDGEYELGGQQVFVKTKRATLADGTLAGSVLGMPQAIKNMVQFTGCSLIEAIHMASWNPARSLGLLDRKGSITQGKDADLVVMNAHFETVLNLRGGRVVFKSGSSVNAANRSLNAG